MKYIRDEGKIRNCDSNVSKMNIFQVIYCYIFHWGYFQETFAYIYESLKEVLFNSFELICNLCCLIFTPITVTIYGVTRIKNAKKRMKRRYK